MVGAAVLAGVAAQAAVGVGAVGVQEQSLVIRSSSIFSYHRISSKVSMPSPFVYIGNVYNTGGSSSTGGSGGSRRCAGAPYPYQLYTCYNCNISCLQISGELAFDVAAFQV
jgi:hypothetical protein